MKSIKVAIVTNMIAFNERAKVININGNAHSIYLSNQNEVLEDNLKYLKYLGFEIRRED